MADIRTTVTELATGLGMLGFDDVSAALSARPQQMASVSPEIWRRLEEAYEGGGHDTLFQDAFENGRALLVTRDGLRNRLPLSIEWKGAQSNPGDEVLPADLRIDHVFLVSCKYLSNILHNASPSRVFDNSLMQTRKGRSQDWFHVVAPLEYQALYEATLIDCGLTDMPKTPGELNSEHKEDLKSAMPDQWSETVNDRYAEMCSVVASESAARWRAQNLSKREQEATFWRIARLCQAPYFILGSSKSAAANSGANKSGANSSVLRLRIATPWDWRQRFELKKFEVSPKPGGQAMVSWSASIKDKNSNQVIQPHGHVEVRWSHRRFVNHPEAKVYVDSPHTELPGYFLLA